MIGILLLNASFEPIYVISPQRAASLLLGGQALPVQDEPIAAVLRSVSTRLEIPTVLRLARYVNVPRRGAHWSKAGVMQRDGWRCIYCGVEPGDKQRGRKLVRSDFCVDHIIPRSRGGDDSWVTRPALVKGAMLSANATVPRTRPG